MDCRCCVFGPASIEGDNGPVRKVLTSCCNGAGLVMDDTGGSIGFVVAVAPEKLCSKGLGSWSSFELEFKGSTAIGGSLSTK